MKHRNVNLSGMKKLAKQVLKAANENRIIGLIGPLGSGKTTFTKYLTQLALGITSAKSPTFTIVHCYQNKGKSLYHIDLYRLEKAKELVAIGLDEILEKKDSLVVIEWVDKFPKLMKKCDTLIEFQVLKNNLRNVIIKNN
jgi:tRNA threonylcarbamoyladenosine biosynthesis protein TsaE